MEKVCNPKSQCDLNLIDLEVWDKTNLIKLMQNVSGKSDSLWVKWVHAYYLKNQQIIEATVQGNSSRLMNVILKQRESAQKLHAWNEMKHSRKFNMRKTHMALHSSTQKVEQRTLFFGNVARPSAIVNQWLACHEILATRTILHKLDLIDKPRDVFVMHVKIKHHMFECKETKVIWESVLDWIQVQHHPVRWSQQMKWIIQMILVL